MKNGPLLPWLRNRKAIVLTASAAIAAAACLTTAAFAGPPGSLDPSFILSQAELRANTLSVEPGGGILIGGTFSKLDGQPRGLLARVQSDGTLDTTFVPPAIQSYNTLTDKIITKTNPAYIPIVFTSAIQADGKILVGGSFFFINGQPGYGGLIRLNTDGSVDNTFTALRFNGSVQALLPLPDGRILVGGNFNYVSGYPRNALAELEPSGQLNRAFDPGTFAGPLESSDTVEVNAIATESGGKIVVGGIFTSIDGSQRRAIARLYKDGKLDGSFVPDAAFNPPSPSQGPRYSVDEVTGLAVQRGGKVVVVGNFRDPSTSSPINSVYRLNDDGSLDQSFNPGGAGTRYEAFSQLADSSVNGVLEESDGKIIIGGNFAGYNGVSENFVARLNTDGTLDTTFDAGTGPDASVFSLALEPDGALLIGGDFQDVDSVPRPLVARLNTEPGVPSTVLVNIVASTKDAYEDGRLNGAFTVTRTGSNQTAQLFVPYTVSGSAKPGVDYKRLSGEVTIPAGQSTALIKVRPLGDDHSFTANRKVTVILDSTAAFTIDKVKASVIIHPGPQIPPP